jgi:hypothetical protein
VIKQFFLLCKVTSDYAANGMKVTYLGASLLGLRCYIFIVCAQKEELIRLLIVICFRRQNAERGSKMQVNT